MKIENQSRKWSGEHDRIGGGRMGMFPFLPIDSLYDSVVYDPVKTRRLSESEAEAEQ